MAVRPIDGSRFAEILEQWKKDCLQDNDQQSADVISDVILQLDDMPTLTPPNEPMTLEQLREMGGKPYWHVGLQEDSKAPHWVILDPFFAKHIENYGYGKRWLAYRRPPEKQEDTDA